MGIFRHRQGSINTIVQPQNGQYFITPNRRLQLDPALTLLYQFAKNKSLAGTKGPTLDITRTTEATYFDSAGVMQTAASGVARFNHLPVSPFTSLGLLVEEARTNICLQSEDFSTTWVDLSDGAIAVDQAIAPDGTLTADQLIDDETTGTGTVSTFQLGLIVTTAVPAVLSCYMKADQLSIGAIGTSGYDAGASGISWFNLSTGAVGTLSGNHDSSGIEDVGNGWYRCWVVFTTTTDVTGNVYFQACEADNDSTVDLDGTSSIFVWGAQLEAGAFPTSYIPTVASSVTRNFDDVSSSTLSWVNTSAGSYYVRSNHPYQTAQTNANLCLGVDGSTNSATQMGSTTSSHANWLGRNGPSGIYNITIVNRFLTSAFAEMVIGYAEDDFQAYADGTAGTLDSGGTPPTGQDLLQVGALTNDTQVWNGHIAEIRYYDERKDNEFLEDLSNGLKPI